MLGSRVVRLESMAARPPSGGGATAGSALTPAPDAGVGGSVVMPIAGVGGEGGEAGAAGGSGAGQGGQAGDTGGGGTAIGGQGGIAGQSGLPTVTIAAPEDGASFAVDSMVVFSAALVDGADDDIEEVEFLLGADGTVGRATEPPYQTSWTAVAVGTYVVSAVVKTKSGSTTRSSPITFSVTEELYLETDGVVAIEAEKFQAQNRRGDLSRWVASTDLEGFVGGGYAVTTRDATVTGTFSDGTEITYRVFIQSPGTYNFWIRFQAEGSNTNSAHLGFDGDRVPEILYQGDRQDTWSWHRHPTPIEASEGRHTLSIIRRESGFTIDRVVLTKSTEPIGGQGPPESPFVFR